METQKNFDELFSFWLYKEDKVDLVEVARKWQLHEAEIARRALRAGLEVLRSFDPPGVQKRLKKTTAKENS